MPETITINIYKAQKLRDIDIPSITIRLHDDFPDNLHYSTARELFQAQAEALANAFQKSLPQGTRRRLVALLMKHDADETMYVGA